MMGPFRGFVEIADHVLAAAREVARAVVDAAVSKAEEPTPPPASSYDAWVNVIRRLIEMGPCRKWRYVDITCLAAHPSSRVLLRCGECHALSSFDVTDRAIEAVGSDDRRRTYKAIEKAIADAGCFCVERRSPDYS